MILAVKVHTQFVSAGDYLRGIPVSRGRRPPSFSEALPPSSVKHGVFSQLQKFSIRAIGLGHMGVQSKGHIGVRCLQRCIRDVCMFKARAGQLKLGISSFQL